MKFLSGVCIYESILSQFPNLLWHSCDGFQMRTVCNGFTWWLSSFISYCHPSTFPQLNTNVTAPTKWQDLTFRPKMYLCQLTHSCRKHSVNHKENMETAVSWMTCFNTWPLITCITWHAYRLEPPVCQSINDCKLNNLFPAWQPWIH